jgi:YcaO-like protein with predicted kinase domain
MAVQGLYVGGDEGVKSYRLGTHRTVEPQATLDRVGPFMDEMGITRIANVTGLDTIGIPVVMVCRPNSRSISVSQGKGVELAAAKASGLMEAVETYHAERITLPLKLCSFEELSRNHPVVDVSRLPFARSSRYRDDLTLLWIEGRNLLSEEPGWLPHEMVHTDYSLPQPTGSGCFPANTNGLASGNHMLEAVAHGIYEVIERDALTLWRLDPDSWGVTSLDMGSVGDSDCLRLLEKFHRAGLQVRVWNVTSDVGVACFFCMLLDRENTDTEPEFGSGCHPASQIALLRALTEAAQARTTYIAGSRDDFSPDIYSASARAKRTRACRELAACQDPTQSFREVPAFESETLAEDVAWTLDRLQSAGVNEVIAVDLSQERFQVPVARVVIPGLEGVYKGEHSDYSPGARASAVLRKGR